MFCLSVRSVFNCLICRRVHLNAVSGQASSADAKGAGKLAELMAKMGWKEVEKIQHRNGSFGNPTVTKIVWN